MKCWKFQLHRLTLILVTECSVLSFFKNHYIISSSFLFSQPRFIFHILKVLIYCTIAQYDFISLYISQYCTPTITTNLTSQEPLGRSRMNIESLKAKKRVVKLITIVILIFTICWLPLQVNSDFSDCGISPEP